MATPRLYAPQPLDGDSVTLGGNAFHHGIRVLRLGRGDAVVLFSGDGAECDARITTVARDHAQLTLGARRQPATESPLHSVLLQAVGKGERMDWALQKATELGVSAIQPVLSSRCNVRMDAARWSKKQAHWQSVVVSACEQSGRVRVPEVAAVCELDAALADCGALDARLWLDPEAVTALPLDASAVQSVALLIGPEGGFSPEEITRIKDAGFSGWRLGPRVLRTETAPVAALALLQARFGDAG